MVAAAVRGEVGGGVGVCVCVCVNEWVVRGGGYEKIGWDEEKGGGCGLVAWEGRLARVRMCVEVMLVPTCVSVRGRARW